MNIADRLVHSIDDAYANKLLSALMHALAAVDGTGHKLYPNINNNRDRFITTIESYYWILEPMLAIGINLDETTFDWIKLEKRAAKFSEVIYEIFRCNLAHGTEIPSGFTVHQANDPKLRVFEMGQQSLSLPSTLIYGLCAIALFSNVNKEQKSNTDYWLSQGDMHFTLDDWWGRESDARICFSTVRMPRITMKF